MLFSVMLRMSRNLVNVTVRQHVTEKHQEIFAVFADEIAPCLLTGVPWSPGARAQLLADFKCRRFGSF